MLPQLWGGGDDANMQNKIYTVDTEIILIHAQYTDTSNKTYDAVFSVWVFI